MVDLSHWDVAMDFTGEEAAALIVGIDPAMPGYVRTTSRPVLERMERSYGTACAQSHPTYEFEETADALPSISLSSAKEDEGRPGFEHYLHGWLTDDARSGFDIPQRFDRAEIVRWLGVVDATSKYQFDLGPTSTRGDAEIDPSDFPDELDAANIAFRSVKNGYGDQSATPKNRTIAFLQENYPRLSNEAVQRIATVANPDKTTGRKKREAE